jgi:hypothetical protein
LVKSTKKLKLKLIEGQEAHKSEMKQKSSSTSKLMMSKTMATKSFCSTARCGTNQNLNKTTTNDGLTSALGGLFSPV